MGCCTKSVRISEETYARLEEIVAKSKREYPGYGHLTNTADELAESYIAEKVRGYDEMKRIESLPRGPFYSNA